MRRQRSLGLGLRGVDWGKILVLVNGFDGVESTFVGRAR